MQKISNDINNMFKTLFTSDEHPFFKDFKQVETIADNYRKKMFEYSHKLKIPYIAINNIPDGIKINTKNYKYKTLTKEDIYKLQKEINNVMNFNNILALVNNMSQYIIKSNVPNKKKLYKKIAKEETINIMIIGSGPVGLFLACYLNLYYNNTKMPSKPRVNIVLFDNKIEKSGFRKPYNRMRPFATSSPYLNLLIPKLYCWNENKLKDTKDSIMINIFILEYILYMKAYLENIPMIYEDYTWDEYMKIIEKGNFKVVFDCTGGRLKHNAIKSINTKWLDNIINQKNYNNNIKLEIIPEQNLVILPTDSKHIINYFYASLIIYNNNYNNNEPLTFYNKFDIDIMNIEDLMYLNKLKYKYFTSADALYLIKGIKDDNTRNFLYTIMKSKDNYIVSFDVWSIYIRHAIKISDIITVNNSKILFIAAGDSIFHSHFITGAGLNRILDFTVKCANMLAFL